MLLAEYPEPWEMKPRRLTSEEIDCPDKVIEEFFQYAHLPEVRAYLWEGMKTLITGSFVHLKIRERTNLIYFYEQVEKLIEVVHVIHEQRIKKRR